MKKHTGSSEPQLSRRERQIIDLIYANGTLTATQVQEALLPDELSNSSVRTFLRILTDKGHLTYEKQGRQFVYSPVEARPKAGASALQRVIDTFFNGSVEQAVAGLMEESERVDSDELAKLEELIKQAKKEGR